MKHLYKVCTACLALACILLNLEAAAQSLRKMANRAIIPNAGGYWEYLPQNYNAAGNQRYPVLVYFHGDGDRGSGSSADLDKMVANALPYYLGQGGFPRSFTVNGETFEFIVIAPQYANKLNETETGSIIKYIKDNYRVDTNRIYLTGMSLGGGIVWEYAGSSLAAAKGLAGIIPICGYTLPLTSKADNIAAANLPVWATHNDGDPNVDVAATLDYIRLINNRRTPPTPLAKATIFQSNEHDAWTETYKTTFTESGVNVFQWALQYTRLEAVLPVTLTNYRIADASKQGVTITWSTGFEQHNQYFSIERSDDGITFKTIGRVTATNEANGSNYSFKDASPLTGDNYYRLSQTDLDGKLTYFTILRSTIDVQAGKLVLFPNPATTSITVGFNQPDKDRLTVKVLNQQGVQVQVLQFDKEAGYWQRTIPVGQLAKGQYFIQVKGAKADFTQSVIIGH